MGLATVVRTATASLLVFLVCAAVLALLGSRSEARMIEAVAVATAAPMGPGVGERWLPFLPAASRLPQKDKELRWLLQEGECDHVTAAVVMVAAPTLPNLIELLREGGQVLEILRVYYVLDVGGHLWSNRTFWFLSTEAGFRALRWSIRTYGLFAFGRGGPTI